MSSPASHEELSHAILQQVQYGAYPESENVASTNIPPEALPGLLDAIGKSQEGIKSELRQLSRQSAPDIDGWITQAKQLQADIERSKATAREIVQEAEAGKALKTHEEDASNKVDLLRKELDFNVTLADTLEQLQIISGLLDTAQNAISEGQLMLSLEKIVDGNKIIDGLDTFENTRFAGLAQRRATQLKDLLVGKIQDYWHSMVITSSSKREVTILPDLPKDGHEVSMDLEEVVHAMGKLEILESHVSRLHRDLYAGVIDPRFTPAADGAVSQLQIERNTIKLSGRDDSPTTDLLLQNIGSIIKFLTNLLPSEALDMLLEKMLPSLMIQLITNWLEPAVPIDPKNLGSFEDTVTHIMALADIINLTGIPMPSDADLALWVDRLPQIWLARRREASLASMRSSCYEWVKFKKVSERAETQVVSRDDVMVTGTKQEDDWNAGWSDEEKADEHAYKTEARAADEDEDEDASAWGLTDDSAETSQTSKPDAEDEGEEEAWGWGDEEAVSSPTSTMKPLPTPRSKTNGALTKQNRPAEREITLRETFSVTSVPDGILELIHQILSDAETLSHPSFAIPSISAAAPALSSLPTLLLALYRATARTFYASDPAADMLIYNDSQHLSTTLQKLLSDLPDENPLSKRLQRSLDADTKLLATFSRLAYGREMDSQRTILSDLLSSTSGFANSTAPLNAREYRNAIDDVVARVRQVDKTWKGILSDSARLQSLGALLSHVIRKVIEDILELADEPSGISEEESKNLKGFCDQIADLADLFQPDEPDANGERKTLVHVYTPDWLRFGYLGELLEASLADIKFLWVEGELSLEFDANEVVGLIEALFAESHFRRDAIREIRGR